MEVPEIEGIAIPRSFVEVILKMLVGRKKQLWIWDLEGNLANFTLPSAHSHHGGSTSPSFFQQLLWHNKIILQKMNVIGTVGSKTG